MVVVFIIDFAIVVVIAVIAVTVVIVVIVVVMFEETGKYLLCQITFVFYSIFVVLFFK